MAKIIKYILLIGTILALGLFCIYKLTAKTWVYDLPNNYKLRKTATANVTLGVEIDGDFYTKYQGKKVGIEEYIAEFQENEQFVGVKVLEVEEDTTNLLFYLIDTKEREVHGPYRDEESYLAASGVWSEKGLGDWKTTTETPEGAYFK